ncbi:adhesion G-protein coupled receptor G4 [Elgaria multicarinata webbii]|uniref:adhesion G-protein coupled receptor G4 n=1 Tax=Elgaria multicarinata webbii TaxID=159646 RepID=UPI002FCD5D90
MEEKQASQSYFSKSIIKATSNQTIPEIMGKLQTVLCGSYAEDSLSMTVDTNDVSVAYIALRDPTACPGETIQSKYKGSFTWPKITPDNVIYRSCEKNREQNASRACLINIRTEKAYWKRQNLTTCRLLRELPDNIMALKNVTITVENAKEVADLILILLHSPTLSKEEIEVLVAKLTDIANCEEISESLAKKALQIINIFMTEEPNIQELQAVLNRVVVVAEPHISMSLCSDSHSRPLPIFNGLGGWDTSGCEMEHTDANYTICNCSHLTHFGVLLDLSRTSVDGADDQILTLISYVGCGISSIFLGLALVVYLSIEKLRGDYPSRILINLCFALLMLNLTFLVNSWLASFHNHDLCIAVAVVLHYFLLAAFTWMGLEAIHMYYALIKVFNTYIPNYMIKFAIVGWGVPAVIVAAVLIISPDIYGAGSVDKSTSPLMHFCWIKDNVTFYISVVAYFGLVFLLNVGMFITVLLQIHTMKGKNPVRAASWNHGFLHDLKRVASLTFLLGLTWGFAFFAWGPVKMLFIYLFAICNTLQGFFIFIFHCLMKENVRKQCQMHFCCGRFRLSYSRQVCCTSLTYQTAKLPHVRKTSPMNAELECPQKTRFLR